MPFAIGENIGPYKIVEETGHGGMATVYKAYHQSLDRYVAIKAIQMAFVDDKDFLARFQREAKVVARLEHPNIVPIYDFSQFEGRPYIVMKFITGESLKDHMKRKQLGNAEILEILTAVGAALSYAHKQNVLHRDIKPANVLLSNEGNIYLADFGLARIAMSGEASITGDRMIGTPYYMSPEQGLGLANIDTRTDIYSLGVMLYEMVAGRVPFNSDTPFTIIHDHIYTPPPAPHTFNPNVSPDVDLILEKALSKDPKDRYPDVTSLVNAFRSFVEQSPLASLPDSEIHSLPPAQYATDPIPQAVGNNSIPEWANNRQDDPNKTRVIGEIEPEPPPLPPDLPPAPPPEPLPVTPVAKKKNKTWIYILAGLAALILISSFIYLAMRFRAHQNDAKLTQTAAVQLQANIAQPMGTLQPTPAGLIATPDNSIGITPSSPTPAQPSSSPQDEKTIQQVDAAIHAWNNGDSANAKLLMMAAINSSARDSAFYDLVVRESGKQNAWGLAAYVLFNSSDRTPPPVDNVYRQTDKIHEVVYNAASDPRSGELFKTFAANNPLNPYLPAAAIRYQLYYGDKTLAGDHLNKMLSNPLLLKRFPEAKLLDVEYSIKTNDLPTAKLKLNNLLQDSASYSKWIIDEAHKLESVLNPS